MFKQRWRCIPLIKKWVLYIYAKIYAVKTQEDAVTDTQNIHPHLTGLLEPMRSEDDFDLKAVGRIPDALARAYYRNGANPQFDPQGPYFPFLGDGMIYNSDPETVDLVFKTAASTASTYYGCRCR
jgi:carotenoid cleavage dioxygenase-like enzyme